MVFTETVFGMKLQSPRLAAYRDKVVQAVAAVDIGPYAHRTETMCRIKIAVASGKMLGSPAHGTVGIE